MKKIIFVLILLFLMTTFSFSKETRENISIIIFSNKNVYELWEQINITIELKNNSNQDVWIVHPQDGSEKKFRYPYCFFEVFDKNGKLINDIYPGGTSTKPLSLDAFYRLPQGESISLYKNGYLLSEAKKFFPGKYSLTFYYSTNAEKDWQWFGTLSEDSWSLKNKDDLSADNVKDKERIKKMLKNIIPLELVSNTIVFELMEDKLPYLKQEYDKLYTLIQPVAGTTRQSIEAVYGKPVQMGTAATPSRYELYKYWDNTVGTLIVHYKDDKTEWATIELPSDLTLSLAEISREDELSIYENKIKKLEAIRKKYSEALSNASWNQK